MSTRITTSLRRTTGQKSYLELLVRVVYHQAIPRGKGEGEGKRGGGRRTRAEPSGATKRCDVELSMQGVCFPGSADLHAETKMNELGIFPETRGWVREMLCR
jgi:hypothetical protein